MLNIVDRDDNVRWSAIFLWIIVIFVVVSALGVVLGYISLPFAWASQPVQILSPENVRKQWAFAYQYDESLQSAARQVCLTEQALAGASSEEEKTQRRSQLLAYQQNYTRIQADYNSKLRNAFEAKWVKPDDVPQKAPELVAMKQRVCGK